LDKVGIVYQGTIPDYYEKWGEKEDRVEYLLHVHGWHGSSDR
jgi:hypothetical protein